MKEESEKEKANQMPECCYPHIK